jgi:sulfide:quinone oxidoreductase
MRVLIAGGGVAGLEAALTLRDLAADVTDVTVLAPEETFEIRALSVRDAFGSRPPQKHRLADLAADAGFVLEVGRVASVDPDARVVTTDSGASLSYDALLLAIGARAERALPHAGMFGGPEHAEAVHGMLQDLEVGAAKRIAFVAPPGNTWPLPLYELALLTSERARSLGLDDVSIMVVTPEERPLQIFGDEASAAVSELLAERGISVLNSTAVGAETRVPAVEAAGRRLPVDRIIALPVLRGPAIPGLPADEHGFLPVDAEQKVVDGVWAAGDGANFPIKQGGIAAQQADVAALAIAAAAGAAVEVRSFHPVLRGMLLTGEAPRYLRAASESGDVTSAVAEHALWWPPTKVAGPRLAPYLWAREEGEQGPPPPPPDSAGVAVERPVGDHAAPQPSRQVEIHSTDGHLELLERQA